MSERIDIANMALTWLGASTITGFEDDAIEAEIINANYYIARDATLEAHEWSFAIKRWEGAKEADSPEWGANNRFTIPNDILRVLAVEAVGSSNLGNSFSNHQLGRAMQADWLVESGYIITDEDAIYCRGIRQVTDEGIYSPLFCHAFAAHLAMLCTYALSESNVKFNAMSALYQLKIQQAKSRDAVQGSNKRIRNRSLQNVR